MKNILSFPVLFVLLSFVSPAISNAQPCHYEIGDEYSVKSKSNIRELPNLNSKIICSFEYEIVSTLVIQSDSVVNGFIKIKIKADSNSFQRDFNNKIGWISTKLIEYENWDGIGGSEPAFYTKAIYKQEEYRRLGDCKYSAYAHANLLSLRGISYYKLADYFTAISDFTKSIETDPTYKFIFKNYQYRASSKQYLKDFTGAISDYTYCILNCGKSTDAFTCECGICALYDGKNALNFAGSNYPGVCKENLLTQRASCYIYLEKYQLAMSDLNTAIALNPKWGNAYYIRGQLKDILNDKDGCCKDLSKAGELGIQDAYTQISLRCNK